MEFEIRVIHNPPPTIKELKDRGELSGGCVVNVNGSYYLVHAMQRPGWLTCTRLYTGEIEEFSDDCTAEVVKSARLTGEVRR